MTKFWHKDIVWDFTSTAHPAFGRFVGHAGADRWINGVIGQWDFDPAAMKVTCVNGPTPGTCVHGLGST